MNQRLPDLDALIGKEVIGTERERLRRAHQALLQAGPLPELPRSLQRPPAVSAQQPLLAPARRRRFGPLPGGVLHYPLGAAAAAFALAAAGAGYLLTRTPPGTIESAVVLHATAAAPRASATLRIGARDRAGNWPLTLRVRGLPELPRGGYYEMYLTNKGRLVDRCGIFRTDGGATIIHLNVPDSLGRYSGWLIRPQQPQQAPGPPLLTTTS